MDLRSRMPISSQDPDRSKGVRYSNNELCRNFRRGQCHRGANCKFAHEKTSAQSCRTFFQSGSCRYGEKCKYSHSNPGGDQEILPMQRERVVITLGQDSQAAVDQRKSNQMQQKKLKMRLCSYWERYVSCRNGDQCSFAHGEEELQNSGSLVQETGSRVEIEANAARNPIPGRSGEDGRKPINWWNSPYEGRARIYADWID